MQPYKLPNAAASVLTISSTALSLQTAITTAGSETIDLTGLDAIDFTVSAEDVSILWDGNTPTAANGVLIGQNNDSKALTLRGIDIQKVMMIRTGGADATVRVQIGKTNR